MRRLARPALSLLVLISTPVLAMKIVHESLDAVLERTGLALVAEIQAVSEPVVEGIWKRVDLTAAPVRVLLGKVGEPGSLRCAYAQGMPHRRGEVNVSPLVTGSGIEFGVKKGDRVILLLARPPDATAPCEILRVEPLEREKLIRAHPPGKPDAR